LKDFGPPLVVVYLMADIGSIGGGWLSSSLIKRGWTINAGRKVAMFICALFPRRAVGSVVGIGGMAGAVGGMMIARLVGEILERTGSYVPIFIIAASPTLWHYFSFIYCHLSSTQLIFE
jgi:ACS family hexuronate transporter-like MFS transporter